MQTQEITHLYSDFEPLKPRRRTSARRRGHPGRPREEAGFTCAHCHQFVPCSSTLSRVQNRNHCPYCLWSRHLDLNKPGDRLSACKARMQPMGLTLKKTNKKYGPAQCGELMLIHVCTGCGRISINRIAADDDASRILDLFQSSLKLAPAMIASFCQDGIRALRAADKKIVHSRLFGNFISIKTRYDSLGEM